MPVTAVHKDLDARTLTITAEFAAGVERVWQVYADPRQLERFWGPPGYPATVAAHDLTPGGRVHYFMTGPQGEKYYGGWRVLAVAEPDWFSVEDFFADADFNPNPELPVSHCEFRLEPIETGTRAIFTTTYATTDDLQQVLDLGVEAGATAATNQIDGLLAEG